MAELSNGMSSPVILAENPFSDRYALDTSPRHESVFAIGDGEEDEEPAAPPASEHAQVPNPTLQRQAIQLMLDLFPGHTATDIKVTQMHSNPHNLTIHINLFPPSPPAPWYTLTTLISCLPIHHHRRLTRPTRYTLRIPSTTTPSTALTYEVTTLTYLSHAFPQPVPKVTVYDSSTSNALSTPYILYERLPGSSLRANWDTLNAAQRQSAARGVASLFCDLQKLRNKCAGVVSPRNTVFDFKQDVVRLEKVPLSRSRSSAAMGGALPSLADAMSTRELLHDLVKRQRNNTETPGAEVVWTRVEAMIEALSERGVIPDSEPFFLQRSRLDADHILVSVVDDANVKITGVLSWGDVLFGPKFLGAQVPQFLLSGGGGEIWKAYGEELVGVLAAFEGGMGEEWCKMAYRTETVLAWKLWAVLLKGLVGGCDVFAAEEMLDEFENLGMRA
ncbi:APH domain-containing protein [Pyrenophora tritici-repentis]|nr:APH domain-containing protein [Pyrenophora tritici-repentis]KAI0607377.1 APH domain-containing protein [Pyrenophora tritici-repentis]KAI0620881.1 APH domain-containing protein [Pyrenophora tritici-repentis]